jgi:hypothetical protein
MDGRRLHPSALHKATQFQRKEKITNFDLAAAPN